jgi:peptide/nickel transport system permease protein
MSALKSLAGAEAAVPQDRRGPAMELVVRLIRTKPLGAFGAMVFLFFLVCGLLANVLSPYGINETNPLQRLQPPSFEHWLGTDHLGRDMLSRVLHGAQLSMIVAVLASGLSVAVSVAIGMVAGYFRGATDLVVQRFVDAWMIFPDLILLIAVISIIGPGALQIVVVLGLLYGVAGSRIVRGTVMQVREMTYTRAAQAMGGSPLHILWRHILPNIGPVVILLFTSRIGAVILAEAGLSFLGLGVPPPAPTWGGMLSGAGRSYMYVAPWLAIAPGLCLTLVVYSINVFGDALRDLLDPRMRGAR